MEGARYKRVRNTRYEFYEVDNSREKRDLLSQGVFAMCNNGENKGSIKLTYIQGLLKKKSTIHVHGFKSNSNRTELTGVFLYEIDGSTMKLHLYCSKKGNGIPQLKEFFESNFSANTNIIKIEATPNRVTFWKKVGLDFYYKSDTQNVWNRVVSILPPAIPFFNARDWLTTWFNDLDDVLDTISISKRENFIELLIKYEKDHIENFVRTSITLPAKNAAAKVLRRDFYDAMAKNRTEAGFLMEQQKVELVAGGIQCSVCETTEGLLLDQTNDHVFCGIACQKVFYDHAGDEMEKFVIY